jgi:hypothetical protein
MRKDKSGRLIINSGDKFGKLTILKELHRVRLPSGQLNRVFECQCDCGNIKQIRLVHLRNDKIKSCGCIQGERHYSSKTKLYGVWRSMNQRCYKSYATHAESYRNKGISVCKEWRESYLSFKQWAQEAGYREGLQIDRIDNDGNYEPSNCRFITREININNREITVKVLYKGELHVLIELLRSKGLVDKYSNVKARLKRGWGVEDAVDTPSKNGKYLRGPRNLKKLMTL